MMKTYKKGFTLVELLVVIAIIGLLSTLAIVALNSARQRARDAKRVSDIRQIQTALQLYFDSQNEYPFVAVNPTNLGAGSFVVLSSGGWEAVVGAGATVYMGLVPSYPTPGPAAGAVNYAYNSLLSNGGAACPDAASTCAWYTMTLDLEANTGSLKDGDDVGSIPNCTANPDGITCT